MIAVAVSGGVDSLACLLLLRQSASVPLIALHGLFCADAQAPPGLQEICARLAIPLHIADLRRQFGQTVIKSFIAEHAAGRTPNPCAICNRRIKFGALLQVAHSLGSSSIATGHYARLERTASGGVSLAAGADHGKDQSYFLSLAPPAALAKAIFPLGEFTKKQARELVAKANLAPPLEKESQDICFLAKKGAQAFLAQHLPARPGPILLRPGADEPLRRVGNHSGLWRYTIGQRRGLGIAWREPLYVCDRNLAANALLLAPRELALMRGATVGGLNILAPTEFWPGHVYVKLRYNQKPVAAACLLQDGALRIRLAQPVLATAPGQVAVIYDEVGRTLCGGIVEKVEMT